MFQEKQQHKKYIHSTKYREIISATQALAEQIQGHSQKISDRVEYQKQHILHLSQLLKSESQAKQQRYFKAMEDILLFKLQMNKLVDNSIQKSKQLEQQILQDLKKDVSKAEKSLREATTQNEENIKQLTIIINQRINRKIIEFEKFRQQNQKGVQTVRQLASVRIKKAETRLIELKKCYQCDSQIAIDRLMDVYSKYHTKIEEQKNRRVKQKREFLDLVDKSIQKLKQVFNSQ